MKLPNEENIIDSSMKQTNAKYTYAFFLEMRNQRDYPFHSILYTALSVDKA